MNRLIIHATQDHLIENVIDNGLNNKTLLSAAQKGHSLESLLAEYLSNKEILRLFQMSAQDKECTLSNDSLSFSLSQYPVGKKNHFLLIVEELSPRHNLNRIKDYLTNVIRYSPGYMYLKNTHFQYILCNENFAKAAGLSSADQIIGKTDYDLAWSKTEADLFRKGDLETLAGVKKINFEEPQSQADGKKRIVLANKVPLYDSKNTVIGILGNYLDISNQKQLEADLQESKTKAEAANQAKTEFLKNMRHDIRTPLTGIIGFADLLKIEAEKPQIKEYAEHLVASSHALLDLLDELLEAVRVSSGEIPLVKKKFNLHKTLQHITKLNRAKACQKKLQLTLDIDSAIPSFVLGDKVRVHRVILELTANALNFTDKGFVHLSAQLTKRNNKELIVTISVEDSGIGIPKEKQEEIYEQFNRLTPSYQGKYKGVGLGLSVVKQFIDELKGDIYVESAPGKGSKFTCIIPLQESFADPEEQIEHAAEHSHEKRLVNKTGPVEKEQNDSHHILIVEDNAIAQTAAKSLLNKLGYEISIAETGEKALDLWKMEDFDLIFMDIGLPDLNGYEVTRLIRSDELTKKTRTPIIALTAHVGDENRKQCIEAGMNEMLSKPLTLQNCTDILDTFIPKYQKQELLKSPDPSKTVEKEDLFDLSSFPLLSIEEGIKTTGSKSMLVEMLAFMIEDSLPQDFELMKKAHKNKDWDTTQQLAHKIKGSAVYVGTIKMKMACQYFEQYWKAGHRELLDSLYKQTISVIEQSIVEVSHWLESNEGTSYQ